MDDELVKDDVSVESSLGELSTEELQKELSAAREELNSLKKSGELDAMKTELEGLRKEISSLKEKRAKEKDEALKQVLTHTSSDAEFGCDLFEQSLLALAGGRVRKGGEKNGN